MNVWHGTDRRRRMYVAHFGRFWRSKGSRMDHSSIVAWNDRFGWARVASGSRAAHARGGVETHRLRLKLQCRFCGALNETGKERWEFKLTQSQGGFHQICSFTWADNYFLGPVSLADALGADDEGFDRGGSKYGTWNQNKHACGGRALMLMRK